jgi:S-DNA-T family DNA segregation ATPase FtsK/SpoIIIE
MSKKGPSTAPTGKPSRRRKPAPVKPKRPSPGAILAANAETIALAGVIIGGLLVLSLVERGDESKPALVQQVIGWGAWPLAALLLLASLGVLLRQVLQRLGWQDPIPWSQLSEMFAGLALVFMAALGLSHLWGVAQETSEAAWRGEGGGLAGWLLGVVPATLLGDLLTTILLAILAGLGVWLAARPIGLPTLNWAHIGAQLRSMVSRLLPEQQAPPPPASPPTARPRAAAPRPKTLPSPFPEDARPSILAAPPAADQQRVKRKPPAHKKPAVAPIKPKPRPAYLPPLDLLPDENMRSVESSDVTAKKQIIVETLASFEVPVTVVDVNVGPTVTQFGVEPGYHTARGVDGQVVQRRVRVSRIKGLADDLALALEAPSLRIEAPVPGKGYVGIEVPNSASHQVALRTVLEAPEFLRLGSPLAFALGRDVAGKPVAADLAKMPHLLIAGATGSGKSVCINAIVASLLFNNGPDRLRLLLFDPKRVELTAYNGVPHLLAPVVTDVDQVVGALTWLTLQMDERYRAFARVGARHLDDFNAKVGKKRLPSEWSDLAPFPHLVLVIDELADLMASAPEAVEHNLCRLAQMARATGIHLVVATQRPSVDVITGLIKANFPARIAFAVTSQTDSRVVLDTPGADKLLGRGDMLFMRPDSSKLDRVQGCFVSDKEIARLAQFWQESMPAEVLPAHAPRYPWTGLMDQIEDQDVIYERALDLVQGQERVSTSWLQRRLRVGYNKAAELIARMEADGYIGPDEGAGRGREVLLAGPEENEDDDWLA